MVRQQMVSGFFSRRSSFPPVAIEAFALSPQPLLQVTSPRNRTNSSDPPQLPQPKEAPRTGLHVSRSPVTALELLAEKFLVEFGQRRVLRHSEASRQVAEGSRGGHQAEVPPREKFLLHCLAGVTEPIHLGRHDVPIESNVVPNYHSPVLRHGT